MSSSRSGIELPRHQFRSVHHAATEVREAAILAGADPLYPVPFNRYDPEDFYWWLSPEPDNPAFTYGKIVLAGGVSTPADARARIDKLVEVRSSVPVWLRP